MSMRSTSKRSPASSDAKDASYIEDVDSPSSLSQSINGPTDEELLAYYTKYPNRWSRIR